MRDIRSIRTVAARQDGTRFLAPGSVIELLSADELEQWLAGTVAPTPSRPDVESAFGAGIDRALGLPFSELARQLRFTLAVLRDAFADDVALRGWLHRRGIERTAVRPIDLLLAGRFDQLETLAVREWNRLVAASPISTTP